MDPVEEQLDAYNARDLERFLACYAPDVVVEDGVGKRLMEGVEAMRPVYGGMFSRGLIRADVRTRLRSGEYVVDDEWVTDENRPEQEPQHVIAVYRVQNGLITHVRFLR